MPFYFIYYFLNFIMQCTGEACLAPSCYFHIFNCAGEKSFAPTCIPAFYKYRRRHSTVYPLPLTLYRFFHLTSVIIPLKTSKTFLTSGTSFSHSLGVFSFFAFLLNSVCSTLFDGLSNPVSASSTIFLL